MYGVDIIKFAWQLLPTVMRGGVIMALLRAMVLPIGFVYDAFMTYRKRKNRLLCMAGNVMLLQRVLNDEFCLKDNQIFIETPEDEGATTMFFQYEGKPPFYVGVYDGMALTLRFPQEASVREDFTLWIPTFLCTSLDNNEDKYAGVNLRIIEDILSYYKPAGRWFCIKLYDYE